MTKEQLMEARPDSTEIQITYPSETISYFIKGNVVKALHDPTVGANIIPEYILYEFLDDIPLEQTNTCFKDASRAISKRRGIVRVVPIDIDEVQDCIDLHILDIVDFELLLGYPLELYGTLNKELRKIAYATADSCFTNPIHASQIQQ